MKIKNIAQVSLFALMLGVAGSLSSLSSVMADDATVDGKVAGHGPVDHTPLAKSDTAKSDTAKSDTAKSDTAKSNTVKSDTAKSDDKVNASKVDVSKGTGPKSDGSDQSTVLGKGGAGEYNGAAYHAISKSKDGTEQKFVNDRGNHAIVKYEKKSVLLNTDDSKVAGQALGGLSKKDLSKTAVTATIAKTAPDSVVSGLKSYAKTNGLKTQTLPDGSVSIKAKGQKAKGLVAHVASIPTAPTLTGHSGDFASNDKTLDVNATNDGNRTLNGTATNTNDGNRTLNATATNDGNRTLDATNDGNRTLNGSTATNNGNRALTATNDGNSTLTATNDGNRTLNATATNDGNSTLNGTNDGNRTLTATNDGNRTLTATVNNSGNSTTSTTTNTGDGNTGSTVLTGNNDSYTGSVTNNYTTNVTYEVFIPSSSYSYNNNGWKYAGSFVVPGRN